jgi:hypothetical protein
MELPVPASQEFQLTPLTSEQHPLSAPPKQITDLPFFYLTKKRELLLLPINYEGIDETGRPIRWKVSPNTLIGAPAIDAHKIWHQLIIPTIETYRVHFGHVPEILPLGGVRKCLRALGWTEGGRQARQLLTGLNRIASAWCEADFLVPLQDTAGKQRLVAIKGKFSRLTIYAIGEKHITSEQLASGKFDFDFDLDATLYLQLHRLEVAIQENQEHRYIDNQYMFSVEPTGRRWLEIMAPKIFGVVKNRGTYCEIHYSWYVKHHHTLKRLTARFRIVEQMNSVAADHIRSGYILKPEYRAVKEPGQELDFIIRYRPGPMARESTARIRAHLKHGAASFQVPGQTSLEEPPPSRQRRLEFEPASQSQPPVAFDYRIISELAKRGVGEQDARELLAKLAPGQPVLDQLEWGDCQIAQGRGKIANPPGFYISLLKRNVPVPATFETSSQRETREEAESAQQRAFLERQQAELLAEQEERQRQDAPIAALTPEDRQALFTQAQAALLKERPQMADFFRLNPSSAIEDVTVRKRMRELLAHGWSN